MFNPVPVGKRTRYSYARIKEVMEMPHLLDIQRNSYQWFLDKGLQEIFRDISPIQDFSGNLVLSFESFSLGEPKYDLDECKERDVTLAAPLRVNVRLINRETGEIKEQEVFMGDFPLMTDTGTFIINGAERVIVSQLVRSPGAYYGEEIDPTGKHLYNATVIPNRGAWIELETDTNDVVSVRIDRTRKMPVTYFIRALGFDTDEKIIELFGDEVDRIVEFDVVTGEVYGERTHSMVFPASHYVTEDEDLKIAMKDIEAEMEEQVKKFKAEGKLIEAQRIEQRTRYDLEMMQEMGYCSGIENYSRHLTHRKAGEAPYTLLDYFPEDFLIVMDESHVTLPQLHAMYAGDRSRKVSLVENGFRLPSAFDNRPLTFEEFAARINQIIYVSATPGKYELEQAQQVAQQIIRPTGLLDPEIEVRPLEGQIDDLLAEIKIRIERNERVLVTTLTKKMAENLTDYFTEVGVKVRYLHSDIATIERAEIIHDLRAGEFDVLVGINLLREGLDMPEVSLIAILDADKEGFLRSETSMIQVIGRAARNEHGHVIMYADRITKSMKYAIDETNRRRTIQQAYNEEHHITPHTVQKRVKDLIDLTKIEEKPAAYGGKKKEGELSDEEIYARMKECEKLMKQAAKDLEFEAAARFRDQLAKLRQLWTDRYGSRAEEALKRQAAAKKRIYKPIKKRV